MQYRYHHQVRGRNLWSGNSDTLLSLSHKAGVALLISAAGTKASSDDSRPGAALEEEDGGDDTEGEAERRADEEAGETAVPLQYTQSISLLLQGWSRANVTAKAGATYLLIEKSFADWLAWASCDWGGGGRHSARC